MIITKREETNLLRTVNHNPIYKERESPQTDSTRRRPLPQFNVIVMFFPGNEAFLVRTFKKASAMNLILNKKLQHPVFTQSCSSIKCSQTL